MTVPFIDLATQQRRLRPEIDARINTVLDHGRYIMGPEIHELEANLCKRLNVKHAISCSSGTDALILGLLGLGVKPGEGVIVPSFTFAASAEAIAVLCDSAAAVSPKPSDVVRAASRRICIDAVSTDADAVDVA